MWPRLSEVALGLWLSMSAVLFGGDPHGFLAWSDRASAFAIFAFSLSSIFTRFRRLHLSNAAVALYLSVAGFIAAKNGDPLAQNDILAGLILAMLAIVPTEASRPPKRWRDFIRAHS